MHPTLVAFAESRVLPLGFLYARNVVICHMILMPYLEKMEKIGENAILTSHLTNKFARYVY
jgi:hypothetical protein